MYLKKGTLHAGVKRRNVVPAPVGVRVIDDDEEAGRAPEMQRLLRQPRWAAEEDVIMIRDPQTAGRNHASLAFGKPRRLSRQAFTCGMSLEEPACSYQSPRLSGQSPLLARCVIMRYLTLLRRRAFCVAGRYFDEDFEAAGQRCFKCGGQGHIARDCPNEARPRPCYLCAQFGHTRAQCTNGAPPSPVVPIMIWTPASIQQEFLNDILRSWRVLCIGGAQRR